MSETYIGEIRVFGFNFAPRDWMLCNGQLLPISQYSTLYAIIGTTYGGNGTTNFGLPNLQGQVPMHWGTSPGLNTSLGEVQGSASVTLLGTQIPQHFHVISAAFEQSGSGSEKSAGPTAKSYLAEASGGLTYQAAPATPDTPFAASALGPAGNSVAHENRQPFQVVSFCIALNGIFPSRN